MAVGFLLRAVFLDLPDCVFLDGIREMDGTGKRYIPGELEGSTCTAGIEEINGGPGSLFLRRLQQVGVKACC